MRDGGDRSTSGKCLPKSSTCVINNGELFSLTLILIVLPEIKKLCILLRLWSFLILDHNTLQYEPKLLFMKNLLFPGNSRSSIVSFFRSFLTLQTCWQSFRLENLTITVSFVLPTRWHASIQSVVNHLKHQ